MEYSFDKIKSRIYNKIKIITENLLITNNLKIMDAQALSLNQTIEKLNGNVLAMLSERGKNIFFPKLGILAQSAQARGKDINATIGEAVRGQWNINAFARI